MALSRFERSLISIALEVYKNDIEERIKTFGDSLSEKGREILEENYRRATELEEKFKEW